MNGRGWAAAVDLALVDAKLYRIASMNNQNIQGRRSPTFPGCLFPFPVNSLVLRRVAMDEFDGIRSFFPRPVEAVLDDVVG